MRVTLGLMGHAVGWPLARGGSQKISDALAGHLGALGGRIRLNTTVDAMEALEPARLRILDVTPRQLLGMGGRRLPRRFEKRLRRYRYGPGAFKLDYALDDPVPSNPLSRGAMLEYRGGRTIYITIPTRLPQKGGLAALKL